ncbi:MAG: rod shape-determining protein MreC [Flavobacteriaceae bacterium]|nr:rod shape-determining protein MreC [Flavobacteriaceae bacterium]
MEQLLIFFLRFRNLLLYLFLLTLSLVYAFHSSKSLSNRLTQLSLAEIAPIHHSLNAIYGYFGLKRINDSLQSEIRVLKQRQFNELATRSVAKTDLSDTEKNRYLLHSANIIYATRNAEVNFFIIDKGENDGIKPEMGVIHHDGVVGIIRDVSSNFSRAISILHQQVGISIRNQQTDDVGIMKWTRTTPTKMEISDFQKSKTVSINDTIETSGISTYFPKSIPLGRISKIDSVSNPIYFQLEVELFEDPFSQRLIYVIEDLQKNEIDSLLSSVK